MLLNRQKVTFHVRLLCKSMQQSKEFKTPKTVSRSDEILMLGGRGSYIQYIVDMLILYTIYTTVYTVNMNFILHNGGILENHYQ